MANRRMRKRQKNSGKVCVALIVCLLAGVMSFRIVKMYQKNADYTAQEEKLSQQIESETKHQEELEQYEAYVHTDEYVEEVARNKLGLVYDNEILFKEQK